ncbi:MAG: hypothetical protein KBD46_03275 [Candidatus Levybacteria bacterium]|nr:hypothetical protein [Candidatus Levybacteria bacterium]
MAKKKSTALGLGIIALVIGAIGAAVAGVLSNKKARKVVTKEIKKAEKKVVRTVKKRK